MLPDLPERNECTDRSDKKREFGNDEACEERQLRGPGDGHDAEYDAESECEKRELSGLHVRIGRAGIENTESASIAG